MTPTDLARTVPNAPERQATGCERLVRADPVLVMRVRNGPSPSGRLFEGRTAMNVLDQSDELIRRGAELRARSVRARAAADEKLDKSRRLIATAAKAHRAVMRIHGRVPGGRALVPPPATGRC